MPNKMQNNTILGKKFSDSVIGYIDNVHENILTSELNIERQVRQLANKNKNLNCTINTFKDKIDQIATQTNQIKAEPTAINCIEYNFNRKTKNSETKQSQKIKNEKNLCKRQAVDYLLEINSNLNLELIYKQEEIAPLSDELLVEQKKSDFLELENKNDNTEISPEKELCETLEQEQIEVIKEVQEIEQPFKIEVAKEIEPIIKLEETIEEKQEKVEVQEVVQEVQAEISEIEQNNHTLNSEPQNNYNDDLSATSDIISQLELLNSTDHLQDDWGEIKKIFDDIEVKSHLEMYFDLLEICTHRTSNEITFVQSDCSVFEGKSIVEFNIGMTPMG